MVKYYGLYSNVSRGKRQKAVNDDAISYILELQGDEKLLAEPVASSLFINMDGYKALA